MKSIEERIFAVKFPNEQYNANEYRDWAKENSDEAYKILLKLVHDLESSALPIESIKKAFDDEMDEIERIARNRGIDDVINIGHRILNRFEKDGITNGVEFLKAFVLKIKNLKK